MKPLKAIYAQGSSLVGLHPSDKVYANVLAANVAEVVTVPAGANYVNFASTGNFYANFGAAAAVPATEVTGTASVLNPGLRALDGAATIGLIAPAACTITMEFYS
ncbi:MAG: hypothetical protein WCY59_06020 [Anaerovoracaceae bacterium]